MDFLSVFVNILAAAKLEGDWAWLNPIIEVLNDVLWVILILVGTAGMIYAVVLGVKLAKAESAEDREEAKKRIINAVIALVVIIALILLLQIFIAYAPTWIHAEGAPSTEELNKGDGNSVQTTGIAPIMFVTKLAMSMAI